MFNVTGLGGRAADAEKAAGAEVRGEADPVCSGVVVGGRDTSFCAGFTPFVDADDAREGCVEEVGVESVGAAGEAVGL